ncbi:MAG: glycine oxidase ThiO [Polyangiaceae bacterium]
MSDVLIIGGGIMGSVSAFELARRGASVRVLEKSVPGAEASSAAAGILGAQLEAHAPGPEVDMLLRSREKYREFTSKLTSMTGVDTGYRRCGGLRVAVNDEAVDDVLASGEWQRSAGMSVETLDEKTLATLEPSIVGKAAVRFVEDGQVDPPRLFRALQIAASRAGARFESGKQVRRLIISDGRCVGALLEDGTEALADHTVLAAGSWSTLVEGAPLASDAVRPARGQIVELTLHAPVFSHIVFGAGVYAVPREDGRVLVGSTLEFVGYHKAVTARGVRDLLNGVTKLIPALADASFTNSWSSFRPFSVAGKPLIGRSETPGLILATGHHRNGILLAPITGELVADAILGRDPGPVHGRAAQPS